MGLYQYEWSNLRSCAGILNEQLVNQLYSCCEKSLDRLIIREPKAKQNNLQQSREQPKEQTQSALQLSYKGIRGTIVTQLTKMRLNHGNQTNSSDNSGVTDEPASSALESFFVTGILEIFGRDD